MADWSNTHQYRTRNMGWAIESGFLVENTAGNRTKLEVKNGSPAAYHKYGNNKDHPRIVTTKGASATAIDFAITKSEKVLMGPIIVSISNLERSGQ